MNYIKLSKEISYALRHAPWKYELELDENGWVDMNQLIDALRVDNKWREVSITDIITMMERSDKKRHEIKNNKIRALYGHSIPDKITFEEQEPPTVLYHGTAGRFINTIKEKGLLPMKRQYVHLSADSETAQIVGKRRDPKPVILKIQAHVAFQDGNKFYKRNETIWLTDKIDSKYIIF